LNETITYALHITSTLLLYSFSLWTMFAFSDMKYTHNKLGIMLIYNLICACTHRFYFETGLLPFLGEQNLLGLRIFSLVMFYAHIASNPVSYVRRKLFLLRKKLPMKIDITPG
jgi:hypothetical protein